MDGDPLELGDVVERDGFPEEAEDVTASGPSEGSVLVVRGGVIP